MPLPVLLSLFVYCNPVKRAEIERKSAVLLTAKEDLMSGRLFPILRALNQQDGQAGTIYQNPQQKKLAESITERYKIALKNCKDLRCLADSFFITAGESNQLVSITNIATLKENGRSGLNNTKMPAGSDEVLEGRKGVLSESLSDELQSVNYILDVYVAGKKPRYPKIDGATRLTNPAAYFNDLQEEVARIVDKIGSRGSFYHLPWLTAIKVLELNRRDEAARYEPIKKLNSDVIKKVGSVDWPRYKYSAILVPGLGPGKAGVALDPGGAKRCEMAAAQYKKGVAPLIIVSGGHVHPDLTPYSEAIEMRKYLVGQLGIPAGAVIAEPYARHTTTNIRNAARLIFDLGIPAKMPVLIVTDLGQATFIMFMKARFMEELGYLPYEELSRTRSGEPYFIPSAAALKLNPTDPLDP